MSEKKTNRENRRRRRRRNQLISYCVMAVVLIAVGMGCFFGIHAAGSAVKQHQAAREESRQELLEASRVEESVQAQAAMRQHCLQGIYSACMRAMQSGENGR